MRHEVDHALRRLAAWLLPCCCVLCGARVDGATDLCAACRATLPANARQCPRCALPLRTKESRLECGQCQRARPPWSAVIAPLRYAYPVDSLVLRFKYGGDLAAGAALAQCLVAAVSATIRPDLVVPVPLARGRLRERGYDQAWEIARLVARQHGLRAAPRALRRIRETPAQAGLSAAQRRRNLRGAFVAMPMVAGLHVALVDDVITTGATLRTCTLALLRAGAASVSGWAVARAPLPS